MAQKSLYPHINTQTIHAGQSPDAATGARAVPIYQTAAFCFADSDSAAALFNLEQPGHVYSRISNPTVAVFEERMAALENGVAAIATASGQAALHLSICTLMGAGGHIVASRALYAVRILYCATPCLGLALKPHSLTLATSTLGKPPFSQIRDYFLVKP